MIRLDDERINSNIFRIHSNLREKSSGRVIKSLSDVGWEEALDLLVDVESIINPYADIQLKAVKERFIIFQPTEHGGSGQNKSSFLPQPNLVDEYHEATNLKKGNRI